MSSLLSGRIVGTKERLRQERGAAVARDPADAEGSAAVIRAEAADETGGLLEKLAALFPAELLLRIHS